LPDLKAATAFEKSAGHVRFELGEPFVALGVSDMRGLAAAPVMQLAGKSLEMEQGAQLNGLGQGLHADLDLRGAAGKPADARVVPFSLTLSLLGSRSIAFAPVADMNTF
ncbi:MAG TPA: cell envelope integrity protein CreD, partial [Cupriavidus sp.]|nr:cell envelope integrity protein CreD [Cupriavidus sp.]